MDVATVGGMAKLSVMTVGEDLLLLLVMIGLALDFETVSVEPF